MFVLTEVESEGRRYKGHEVNPDSEGHHADQNERGVAAAASKPDDTYVTGEEDHTACCISVPHLKKEEKKREKKKGEMFSDREAIINRLCN